MKSKVRINIIIGIIITIVIMAAILSLETFTTPATFNQAKITVAITSAHTQFIVDFEMYIEGSSRWQGNSLEPGLSYRGDFYYSWYGRTPTDVTISVTSTYDDSISRTVSKTITISTNHTSEVTMVIYP